MAKLPIMPIFAGDLLSDTEDLSNEEFGAYVRILLTTWRNNGQPLPDDNQRLARVARVGICRWNAAVMPRLRQFFDISDGYWHQRRLENVWENTQRISDSQRAKALRKWNHAKEGSELKTNDSGDAAASIRHTERHMPNQTQRDSKSLKTHGEGKWKPAATVAPATAIAIPHREPVINGYNPNNAPMPGESTWRNRLQSFRDSAFWLGDWGPPPTDPRCWLIVSPADIPHQHLLEEFDFR